jgi:nicotinamidase-related amidase
MLPFLTGDGAMIDQFASNSALLIIDAQKGVNVCSHWGGEGGHRNNLDADSNISRLLQAWREKKLPVYFTLHDSREKASPLKLSLPTGASLPGLEPHPGERVLIKDVNSAFLGTGLQSLLRLDGITRLIVAGYFTNMCVETTVRMAGNMRFDTYLAHDACAASNRVAPEGTGYDADTVHRMSVANMHGEYCTALPTEEILRLLEAGATHLLRAQGNE